MVLSYDDRYLHGRYIHFFLVVESSALGWCVIVRHRFFIAYRFSRSMTQEYARALTADNGQDEGRLSLFPLHDEGLWDMYKTHLAAFWTADEVSLERDVVDWRALSAGERNLLRLVLSFFYGADLLVLDNIVQKLTGKCHLPEARAFYAMQSLIECVHTEMYAKLLFTLETDEHVLADLIRGTRTLPSVASKRAWAERWAERAGDDLRGMLLVWACVEGIQFSSSFAAIFHFRQDGRMPGLTTSNDFIARDEGLHFLAGAHMFRNLPEGSTSDSQALDAVRECAEIEVEFAREALAQGVVGLGAEDMATYVRYHANYVAATLGLSEPAFPGVQSQPFAWMDKIGLDGKVNFFEKRNSTYQRADVLGGGQAYQAVARGVDAALRKVSSTSPRSTLAFEACATLEQDLGPPPAPSAAQLEDDEDF